MKDLEIFTNSKDILNSSETTIIKFSSAFERFIRFCPCISISLQSKRRLYELEFGSRHINNYLTGYCVHTDAITDYM